MTRFDKDLTEEEEELRLLFRVLRKKIINSRESRESVYTKLFLPMVEKESFEKNLSLRWLVSILDTYADYGSEVEQVRAMVGVVWVNTLRMERTTQMTPERGLLGEGPWEQGLTTPNRGSRMDVCKNMGIRLSRSVYQGWCGWYVERVIERSFDLQGCCWEVMDRLHPSPIKKHILGQHPEGSRILEVY